jgi:hypothetical protein
MSGRVLLFRYYLADLRVARPQQEMFGQTLPFDVTAIVSLELDALEVNLTRLRVRLFEALGS